MPGSRGGRGGGFLTSTLLVDMNVVGSSSKTVFIADSDSISFSIKGGVGTHDTHIVELETSLDGINFFTVPGTTLTGEGLVRNIPCTCQHAKVVVITAEGSVSKAKISIFTK